MSSIIQNKFHEIIGDGARTTKFNFIIAPNGGDTKLADIITYSVKSLTLPKMEHQVINIMHKGRRIPIRGTTTFSQTFTVTFYMHENHIVKQFFESWMARMEQRHYYYDPRKHEQKIYASAKGGGGNVLDAISGLFGGGGTPEGDNSGQNGLPPYMTFYNVDAIVEQRNFDGDKQTAIYEIKNVFPISVEPPTYDYSSVGQIAEQTVTFACSHYELIPKAPTGGGLGTSLLSKVAMGGESLAASALDAATGGNGSNTTGNNTGLFSDAKDPASRMYAWDKKRYELFNQFTELERKSKEDKYWRPYELARWNNAYNRWKENAGQNRDPGTPPPTFDPDNI